AIAQGASFWERGIRRRVLEAVLRLVFRRVLQVGDEPVDEVAHRAARRTNLDVDAASRAVNYRDDTQTTPLGEQTIDVFSPSTYLDRQQVARVPMLGISGWFDAAYPHAAIKRHLTLDDARNLLVLGPWNHGITMNMSPHAASRRAAFDLDAELLRFFD